MHSRVSSVLVARVSCVKLPCFGRANCSFALCLACLAFVQRLVVVVFFLLLVCRAELLVCRAELFVCRTELLVRQSELLVCQAELFL